MRNWSNYTPNLSSWINAFLLAGLLIIATSLIPVFYHLWTIITLMIGWIFYFVFFLFTILISILPQFIQFIVSGIISFLTSIISFISSIINTFITLISPLVLLLPIPIIAFAHHYLYLLLDRYYPDLSPAERGRITGYFPGIASWWQGLYGLLVIILGMLVSDAILSILPWMSFSNLDSNLLGMSEVEALAGNHISFWVRIALMIFVRPIYSPFMRLVIWFITAAYLYQFEFKVKQHFIDSALRSAQGDR